MKRFSKILYLFSALVMLFSCTRVFADLNCFEVATGYNRWLECTFLRVNQGRKFNPDMVLTRQYLINLINKHFETSYSPTSDEAFHKFDLICIDSKIKTNPAQFLNEINWYTEKKSSSGQLLNSAVYINSEFIRKKMNKCSNISQPSSTSLTSEEITKRFKKHIEIINKIIWYALYSQGKII